MEVSMKRNVSILIMCIVFIIIYILQANFFSWFTIAGIKPNLFVIFVAFLGLFGGKYTGLTAGVITGLVLDFSIGKNVGVSAIMLAVVGILSSYLEKNFSKDSKITIILIMMASTLIYEVGVYVINAIIFSYEVVIWNIIRILVIEVLYNAILTIILYPLIQKIGYGLEKLYKESTILTRYF